MSQYPNTELIPINLDVLDYKDLIYQAERIINFLNNALESPGNVAWSEVMKWPIGEKENYKKRIINLVAEARKISEDDFFQDSLKESIKEQLREELSKANTWYYRSETKEWERIL